MDQSASKSAQLSIMERQIDVLEHMAQSASKSSRFPLEKCSLAERPNSDSAIMRPGSVETFLEFLLEDLELLLGRTTPNSTSSTDKIDLVMSLCQDLKFMISFLKEIPESLQKDYRSAPFFCSDDGSPLTHLETDQRMSRFPSVNAMRTKVRLIKKKIVVAYIDSFSNTAGKSADILSRGSTGTGTSPFTAKIVADLDGRRKALLERLTGGQKELEVITDIVVGCKDNLFRDPFVLKHFDICARGTICDRSKMLASFHFDEESLNELDQEEMEKRMCKYFQGKRYLIEISVYGGICSFGIWDDLKMYFPNDVNGSKILVSHYYCNPFLPRHPVEHELTPQYLLISPGSFWNRRAVQNETQLDMHAEESKEVFCIQVRYMPHKIFQSPELVFYAKKMETVRKAALQILTNGFPTIETPEGDSVSEAQEIESYSPVVGNDVIVGFDDQALALLNRLTGLKREIEVILVHGMAGIGKTTMAKRLFKSPLINDHFHVRSWASVSQVFSKGNVFCQLLLHLNFNKESLYQMSDEAMGEMLYKSLKGKRYFIVIDDIWDQRVWNDLKIYFPNDESGCKVLMTSRNKDVAFVPENNCSPHHLRFLSEDESWDLFERKVFGCESCPEDLLDIGKSIVSKCKGLPLAIVVVSGLISKKEKTHDWWQHIAEKMGSYIDSDADQFMNVLELSYKYLPQRLKSCFLYLAAFPKDYEIPAKKLVRMWTADGFIQQTEGKRLEDTAENYLLDLVDRSLVMVSRRRSDYGIKTCLVHDMLRTLCVVKACETNFRLPNYSCQACSSSVFARFNLADFDMYPSSDLIDSFPMSILLDSKYAPGVWVEFVKKDVVLMIKFVRVLDLRCIMTDHFPSEILVTRLKYLALHLDILARLPPEISRLWNLETLIIHVEKGEKVSLPESIWTMAKLRHLHVSPEFAFEIPWPSSAGPSFSSELSHSCPQFASCLVLHNLQTVSWLCPLGPRTDILLARIPNVRNLGFHITLSSSDSPFNFLDLSSLNVLEKLKFEYQTYGMVPVTISSPDKFPSGLRKLTLAGSHVDWEEMSIIGMLPNLEVLKAKDNFFNGPKWETCEGGFQRLKFLKFSHMDFQEWIATTDDFPSLEKLVLNGCLKLAEIPSAMGDICTLQVIELYRSSDTVADSARQIQESQRNWVNEEFKVFIYRHFQDNISMSSC